MQTPQVTELEALLIQEAAVDSKHLERARRVASRMQKAKPVGQLLVEMGHLSKEDYERVTRLYRAQLTVPHILHEQGVLDDEGLAAYNQARAASRRKSERQILVDGELVSEEHYLQAYAARNDILYVEPEGAVVDVDLLGKSSLPYLEHNSVLPFRKMDGQLHVIMADPENMELVREMEGIYGLKVKRCCASAEKIAKALNTLERFRGAREGGLDGSLQYREIQAVSDQQDQGEGAVTVVDFLLFRSIEMGASDLHIEPLQDRVRVRVRVDGVLRQLTDLPLDLAPRLISRLKVLGGADISERRLHQDGRLFVKVAGREVDIRFSAYVSMFGETLVMRILDRKKGLVALAKIGFAPKVLDLIEEVALRAASGLVLITGPTGSGKTTTLYSCVAHVNDLTLKVISCEDPVEYVLDGVTQCSVNQKTGPTFADSLKSILRQDPDIIVVGEVRDKLTASMAVESALTGHKVLSTFHTEDAVGAVVRLLEMGVEPFLVASTLTCIVAQRLLRRMCPDCRQPAEPSRKDLRFLGMARDDLNGVELLEGTGCASCDDSGFKGRTGIHEVLMPDDDFRDAILRRAPSKELRTMAKSLPAFLTLQEDGLLKVAEGATTLAEVADCVPRDATARPIAVIQESVSTRRVR